ncbi:hypothetical protein [Bradyrhizobium sp. NP1]|uniref:hypothetical protein n=1 Tax=Bradyrhizobium sp. NP1 TaxID=3049772 RepID=UPI0025A669A6|nr:hypothetical protein [Bradyrhizobium sp. NP1]WJR77499.1 hypothetical protein QOU61_33080 [Bradyrhizobium sp. NP1]
MNQRGDSRKKNLPTVHEDATDSAKPGLLSHTVVLQPLREVPHKGPLTGLTIVRCDQRSTSQPRNQSEHAPISSAPQKGSGCEQTESALRRAPIGRAAIEAAA